MVVSAVVTVITVTCRFLSHNSVLCNSVGS